MFVVPFSMRTIDSYHIDIPFPSGPALVRELPVHCVLLGSPPPLPSLFLGHFLRHFNAANSMRIVRRPRGAHLLYYSCTATSDLEVEYSQQRTLVTTLQT